MSDSPTESHGPTSLAAGSDPSHPLYFAQRRVDLDMLALVNGFEGRLNKTMVGLDGYSGVIRAPWYAPWADLSANDCTGGAPLQDNAHPNAHADCSPFSCMQQLLCRLQFDGDAEGRILSTARIDGIALRVE